MQRRPAVFACIQYQLRIWFCTKERYMVAILLTLWPTSSTLILLVSPFTPLGLFSGANPLALDLSALMACLEAHVPAAQARRGAGPPHELLSAPSGSSLAAQHAAILALAQVRAALRCSSTRNEDACAVTLSARRLFARI
jgi:hypothetical protein